MSTYTYAIESTGNGETWMPEAGAIGTEDYDGTAAEYAQAVLGNWLTDASSLGSAPEPGTLRVVVWDGPQQDVASMAAAVASA